MNQAKDFKFQVSSFKIILAGEGGQGVQALSKVLAFAAFRAGFESSFLPNFGTEQRGGVSLGFVQISKEKIFYPKFKNADLAVILSPRSFLRIKNILNKESRIIFNSLLVNRQEIKGEKIYPVDATNIASQKIKNPRTFNMIILGAVLAFLPELRKELVETGLDEYFKEKYKEKPELRELNKKALYLGYKLIRK